MKKFKITVNGQAYEVEVEEIGGVAPAPAAAPTPAAPAPAPQPAAPAAPAAAPAPAAAAPSPAAMEPIPDGAVVIKAPMPGKISALKSEAGQAVRRPARTGSHEDAERHYGYGRRQAPQPAGQRRRQRQDRRRLGRYRTVRRGYSILATGRVKFRAEFGPFVAPAFRREASCPRSDRRKEPAGSAESAGFNMPAIIFSNLFSLRL